MEEPLPKRILCETIGTYALVFAGCGAMVVNEQAGLLTHPGVSAAWGGVVMILIYAIGDLSGAHLNPAVTIAFSTFKRFPWVDATCYCIAQIVGALGAALTLLVLFGNEPSHLGATSYQVAWENAAFIEFVMSAFLMFVILGATTGGEEKSVSAAIAIGGTIGLEALVGGPLTKASMNPARSIGPALVSGQVNQLLLYIIAPILGTLAGGLVYLFLRSSDRKN